MIPLGALLRNLPASLNAYGQRQGNRGPLPVEGPRVSVTVRGASSTPPGSVRIRCQNMWGILIPLLIGVAVGYLSPGHQDKSRLFMRGLLWGVLIAAVCVV